MKVQSISHFIPVHLLFVSCSKMFNFNEILTLYLFKAFTNIQIIS